MRMDNFLSSISNYLSTWGLLFRHLYLYTPQCPCVSDCAKCSHLSPLVGLLFGMKSKFFLEFDVLSNHISISNFSSVKFQSLNFGRCLEPKQSSNFLLFSLCHSLSHLLSTISNIVIAPEIGLQIHNAVDDFQVSLHFTILKF